MRVGSLFSGYGGLELAIDQVFPGCELKWVCDNDEASSKVLAHRFPGVPNLGDITQVNWGTVPKVDLISGGTPCQDVSQAGRQRGMVSGTRSNLWTVMCTAISVLRPEWVVWENVRGALSAKADSDLGWTEGLLDTRISFPEKEAPALRALGRVLGGLSDLGYDAVWKTIRASDTGACHQRARVFVLARSARNPSVRRRYDIAPKYFGA